MTGFRHNNSDVINAAGNIVQWSEDLLESAPLTADQRDDLQHVERAAHLFYRQASNQYQTVLDSGDTDAIRTLRHQLRNHLNIVVGFTRIILREMPDNLLLHLLTIRKIHQTGKILLQRINEMN